MGFKADLVIHRLQHFVHTHPASSNAEGLPSVRLTANKSASLSSRVAIRVPDDEVLAGGEVEGVVE